jgi:hypothetical protein|mmetsp:Transcript_44800/g.59503  ORF Transcript_44800/g.59503 Transcript_44800/m.59503 type:complete len:187 (-) Transcript_44800:466-1026(-)
MPRNRLKLAHQQGVVAKVRWTPINGGNGYTGFFANGSSNVLMRLSETDMLNPESSGLKPSVAFKILRDGAVSDNVVAMPSFEGSGSWNFLERPMQTRVAPFATNSCPDLTIRKKLTEGSEWPYSCGFARVGQNNEDGTALPDGDVSIPYQLEFAAADPWSTAFSNTKEFDSNGSQVSWMQQMRRVP